MFLAATAPLGAVPAVVLRDGTTVDVWAMAGAARGGGFDDDALQPLCDELNALLREFANPAASPVQGIAR